MREKWCDNLKLLAACGIFFGHFSAAFAIPESGWISTVNDTVLSLLSNGEFLVIVFCIVSGFFVGKKRISSFKELFIGVFNRYIRFLLPVFAANLLAYSLSVCHLFESKKCGEIIHNSWLANKYNESFSIVTVILESITLGDRIVPPLWLLRHLIAASIVMLVISLIRNKWHVKKSFILYGTCVLSVTCIMDRILFFIGVCLFGAVIRDLYTTYKNESKKMRVVIVFLSVCSIILMSGMQNYLSRLLNFDFLRINQYYELIYAAILFIAVLVVPGVHNFFDRLKVVDAANSSLTIYMVHFPLICSLSSWVVLKLYGTLPYEYIYLICFFLSSGILAMLTFIYNRTILRGCNFLTEKIKLQTN